ncbi:MAG: glucose-1-phosphate cytidylyltransferase [Candidatus Saganbacteria bacterium]|nr:glucose-1-phosphate cytidylyltransferase [Candidatus Saganbacteria bacterium]
MEEERVVILAGGRGTRLKEVTEIMPKPMVLIGKYPMLWHILKIYSHFGFKKFIICLGYKGEMIKDYFINFDLMNSDFSIDFSNNNKIKVLNKKAHCDWEVTLVDTGNKSMTGARVKMIEKYINEDNFLLTYGDGVANINIRELMSFHKKHGKIATVTGVYPPARFGKLVVDADSNASQFAEKTQLHEEFINGGYFVLNKKIFEYLSDDDDCVFERNPLEKLALDGQLKVFRHTDYWQCVDTLRDLELLNNIWNNEKAKWQVWND